MPSTKKTSASTTKTNTDSSAKGVGSTVTVPAASTSTITSLVSPTTLAPKTNIITSVVTDSKVSNGVTNTNPVTVLVQSTNTPTQGRATTVTVLRTSVYYYSVPSQTTAAQAESQSQHDKLDDGVIAGIAVGSVAVLCLVAFALFLFYLPWRRRKRSRGLGRYNGVSATPLAPSLVRDDGGEEYCVPMGDVIPRQEKDGNAMSELPDQPRPSETNGMAISELRAQRSDSESEPEEATSERPEEEERSPDDDGGSNTHRREDEEREKIRKELERERELEHEHERKRRYEKKMEREREHEKEKRKTLAVLRGWRGG